MTTVTTTTETVAALPTLHGVEGLDWAYGPEVPVLVVEDGGTRLAVGSDRMGGFMVVQTHRQPDGTLRQSGSVTGIRSTERVTEEIHWRLSVARGVSA